MHVIRNFYTRPLRCMFFCCHVAALHVACALSGSRRSAIFKIEGVDESSLANDDMKQQLLEEILTMCELRFGYARQTQLHDKFDILSKYYFVHSQGQKQTTGTVEADIRQFLHWHEGHTGQGQSCHGHHDGQDQ